MTLVTKALPRGGTHPSYYPVPRWEGPTPRVAWRAMLAADQLVFEARAEAHPDLDVFEADAAQCRELFADALAQANR